MVETTLCGCELCTMNCEVGSEFCKNCDASCLGNADSEVESEEISIDEHWDPEDALRRLKEMTTDMVREVEQRAAEVISTSVMNEPTLCNCELGSMNREAGSEFCKTCGAKGVPNEMDRQGNVDSWSWAKNLLPRVRYYVHTIATTMEDDVTRMMSELRGWDGEQAKTAIRHTGGAVVCAAGMSAGGLSGAVAGTVIGWAVPSVSSSFGCTFVGATGILADYVERFLKKALEAVLYVLPVCLMAYAGERSGPWISLLTGIRDLFRNAASKIEDETVRKMEAMGWEAEQIKAVIYHIGGALLGAIGLCAGGSMGAVTATVLGAILPVVSASIGSVTVEAVGGLVNVIVRFWSYARSFVVIVPCSRPCCHKSEVDGLMD